MSDRVWFKIGEAASRVGATPKELRYWEKVIPELQPRRSRGNLRYYHQDELVRLQRIRQWLAEGCTVSDCRERLLGGSTDGTHPLVSPQADLPGARLQAVLEQLRLLRARLCALPGEAPAEPRPEGASRPLRKAPRPVAPPAGGLFPEAETDGVSGPVAPPKRIPRPKREEGALGRMWSGGRLPLDLEE